MDLSPVSIIVTKFGGWGAVGWAVYGLASDIIGHLPIKANSVPSLIIGFVMGGIQSLKKTDAGY